MCHKPHTTIPRHVSLFLTTVSDNVVAYQRFCETTTCPHKTDRTAYRVNNKCKALLLQGLHI